MLLVNTKDGKTHKYDVCNLEGEQTWARDCSELNFQRSITGLGILWQGKRHTLCAPAGFSKWLYGAEVRRVKLEPVSIRAFVITDIGIVTLQIHLMTSTAQVNFKRTGRPRWTPMGVPIPH